MKTSIYTRHHFHPDIIRRAVWMYFRFNLSFRDIEGLLVDRGIEVSYETIRRWVDKIGSYRASLKLLRMQHLQDVGGRKNYRAECSHVPIRRRERKSQKFRSVRNTQKLLSVHGQIYNLFNHRRHLISKSTLRKFRHQANLEWELATHQ